MDPKMDSGYIPPGVVEKDLDFTAPLKWEEMLAITAELLGFYGLWHQGFSIIQTFLTSKHVDNLLQKDDKKLEQVQFTTDKGLQVHADYCLETVRFTSITLMYLIGSNIHESQRTRTPVWEEEDISTQSYNLSFFDKVNPQTLVDQMSTFALDCYKSQACLKPQRIFIEELMTFLIDLLIAMTHKSSDIRFENWKEAECRLDKIFGYYNSVLRDTNLAQYAFSTSLQKRYTNSTPLRPKLNTTVRETWSLYKGFLRSINRCLQIRRDYARLIGSSLLYTSRYINENMFEDANCEFVYIRVVMSDKFWARAVHERLKDELIQEYFDQNPQIIELLATPYTTEAIQALENQMKEDNSRMRRYNAKLSVTLELMRFIQGVMEINVNANASYIDLFRAQWSNRSRCRRSLRHLIQKLPDLEPIAAQADTVLNEDFFGAEVDILGLWLKTTEMEVQLQYLMMGFELNLYEHHEIPLMYWAIFATGYRDTPNRSRIRRDMYVTKALDATVSAAKAFLFAWICLIELNIIPLPSPLDSEDLILAWARRMQSFDASSVQHPALTSWSKISKLYKFENLQHFVSFRLPLEHLVIGEGGNVYSTMMDKIERRDFLLTQANAMAKMAQESYQIHIANCPEVTRVFLEKVCFQKCYAQEFANEIESHASISGKVSRASSAVIANTFSG
jgi:hypothetical protein